MKERNSRKKLNSLILLVAFTAVMLIVSTYAWFSTQKNVTISGITGTVQVAEGLQISLNAYNWSNEIDFGAAKNGTYFNEYNTTFGLTEDSSKMSITNPYPTSVDASKTGNEYVGERYTNIIPDDLLPASTTGKEEIGSETNKTLRFWRGENTDTIKLSNIHEIEPFKEGNTEKIGYYSIDLFLQNSSSSDATMDDWIQLEKNSAVSLTSVTGTPYQTGLQNTLRVAFVLYENDGIAADKIKVSAMPSQMDIITATKNQKIADVAIWEPNASGTGFVTKDGSQVATTGYAAHVPYVVQNNNKITLSLADTKAYIDSDASAGLTKFEGANWLPTYALTSASKDAKYTVNSTEITGIQNIYNWAITDSTPSGGDGIDDVTGLAKQHVLATSTDGVTAVSQLVSAKNGTDKFKIAPGEYHRMTMYIWLEGQDVDTINWASMGGDLKVDVGISKPGTANQS